MSRISYLEIRDLTPACEKPSISVDIGDISAEISASADELLNRPIPDPSLEIRNLNRKLRGWVPFLEKLKERIQNARLNPLSRENELKGIRDCTIMIEGCKRAIEILEKRIKT